MIIIAILAGISLGLFIGWGLTKDLKDKND